MNDSGYVSLTTIAGFRKVRDLSTSMDDILEALKGAEGVVVDAANLLIKPAFVFERKTVILRDVPERTTEEEIRSLFDGLAMVESVKAEFGNTWYDKGWSSDLGLWLWNRRKLPSRQWKRCVSNSYMDPM